MCPVNGAGIEHPLAPELQGFHGDGVLLQLLLDLHEVRQLVAADFSVNSDLNEPLLLSKVMIAYFFLQVNHYFPSNGV